MVGLFAEELLNWIRSRFHHVESDPFLGPRIYFENAGGGLRLCAAAKAAQRAAAIPDNAGRDNPSSEAVGRIVADATSAARRFLNAREGAIFSSESATAAIFRVLEAACRLRPGGNVVCTNLDHASLYDGARYFADLHGMEWRVAGLNPSSGVVHAEEIARRVDEDTAVCCFTHASNINGMRIDVAAACAAIRARNPRTLILVDGAQHAQHGLVDVAAWPLDAYVFAAYKTFSTVGTTFAYVSPALAAAARPKLRGKPADAWDLGTRDPAGHAAFSAVVEYLAELGEKVGAGGESRDKIVAAWRAIEAHESALARLLLDGEPGLKGLRGHAGLRILGLAEASAAREAVFAFEVAGVPAREAVLRYRDAGVVVHQRTNDAYSGHTLRALGVEECVRASMAHYNTPDEVRRFLEVTGEILEA